MPKRLLQRRRLYAADFWLARSASYERYTPASMRLPLLPSPAPANGAAAAALEESYGLMLGTLIASIKKQNSDDLETSVAGINDQISARQTFDSALAAITLPPEAAADAAAVTDADRAVETTLAALAASRSSVHDYHTVFFDAVVPAQIAFTTAIAALARDLGTTIV